MPRESRAIPKYGGDETEYAVMPALFEDTKDKSFMSGLCPEWLSGGKFVEWDPFARLNEGIPQHDSHSYFFNPLRKAGNACLPNGSRLYDDCTHPELSLPLCDTPKRRLACYKAGDDLMLRIFAGYRDAGKSFELFKNNYGFSDSNHEIGPEAVGGSAVSYAAHENYLVSRLPDSYELIGKTVPWLVLRTLFIGQGAVGTHNAEAIGLPWCDFQISQRADFFGDVFGNNTMGNESGNSRRPIFNTRDVPYADPLKYRRVHVIAGDANMCEAAYFLKIALTSIHFMMLEDGFLDNRFVLVNPVADFWQISRDLTFTAKTRLLYRDESRSYLDLLEEYVALMGEYLHCFDIRDQELHEAVRLAHDVIADLREDPDLCFGVLDYITKRFLIRGELAREGINSWRSARAIGLDFQYSNIDPKKSLFMRPGVQKYHHRIITDEMIARAKEAPPPTRSWLQVELCRRFVPFIWDWAYMGVIDPDDGSAHIVRCGDPLLLKDAYMPLFAGGNKEGMRYAEEAGYAKRVNVQISRDSL